jgi:hypothetical protein
VTWEVRNTGAKPLRLASVRLPHGQFKAAEKQFAPLLELRPGSAGRFHTVVYCNEEEGRVTENAFLIFDAIWLGEQWRIFVRVCVVVNEHGKPASAVERITTQKVGFSGVAN